MITAAILLLSTLSMEPNNCYKFITYKDVFDVVESIDKLVKNSDQLEGSYAYKCRLPSGQILILPNPFEEDKVAILFESQKCFEDKMEESAEHLPDNQKSIVEKYQILVTSFDVNNLYMNLIPLSGFSAAGNYPDKNSLMVFLDSIKREQNTLSIRDKIVSTLLLGELIRTHMNGEWKCQKKYGLFFPYYEPVVLYPDNRILPVFDIARYYWEGSLHSNMFLKSLFVQDPPLNINMAHIIISDEKCKQ